MTTTKEKQEILRSLNNLDSVQTQQVLNFIKDILRADENGPYQQYLKRKAMQEIGHALKQAPLSF